MFHMTSKYFNIFNNKPPASWVTYITRDFLTCYSCSYYSSMLEHSLSRTIFLGPLEVWVTGSSINKATHYKITALLKNKTFVFFWRLFLRNKNCWHFEFWRNQIFGKRFIIFEKLRYRSQLLFKLRVVEVATLFHCISSRST